VDVEAYAASYRQLEEERMNEKQPVVWRFPWRWIWVFSEWSGIGLGRFAPFVFEKMIG
jgi:hypothetical protein